MENDVDRNMAGELDVIGDGDFLPAVFLFTSPFPHNLGEREYISESSFSLKLEKFQLLSRNPTIPVLRIFNL